jgi:hypothetical protein
MPPWRPLHEPSRRYSPITRSLVSEPGKHFNDFIFLASGNPIDLGSPTLDAGQALWLKDRSILLDEAQGVILTDDFNPLERLQTRKAEHYRRILVDWFGTDLLVR